MSGLFIGIGIKADGTEVVVAAGAPKSDVVSLFPCADDACEFECR